MANGKKLNTLSKLFVLLFYWFTILHAVLPTILSFDEIPLTDKAQYCEHMKNGSVILPNNDAEFDGGERGAGAVDGEIFLIVGLFDIYPSKDNGVLNNHDLLYKKMFHFYVKTLQRQTLMTERLGGISFDTSCYKNGAQDVLVKMLLDEYFYATNTSYKIIAVFSSLKGTNLEHASYILAADYIPHYVKSSTKMNLHVEHWFHRAIYPIINLYDADTWNTITKIVQFTKSLGTKYVNVVLQQADCNFIQDVLGYLRSSLDEEDICVAKIFSLSTTTSEFEEFVSYSHLSDVFIVLSFSSSARLSVSHLVNFVHERKQSRQIWILNTEPITDIFNNHVKRFAVIFFTRYYHLKEEKGFAGLFLKWSKWSDLLNSRIPESRQKVEKINHTGKTVDDGGDEGNRIGYYTYGPSSSPNKLYRRTNHQTTDDDEMNLKEEVESMVLPLYNGFNNLYCFFQHQSDRLKGVKNDRRRVLDQTFYDGVLRCSTGSNYKHVLHPKIVEAKYDNYTGTFRQYTNLSYSSEGNRSFLSQHFCDTTCQPGTQPEYKVVECCWKCVKCPKDFIKNTTSNHSCTKCPIDTTSNEDRTECLAFQRVPKPVASKVKRMLFGLIGSGIIMCIFFFATFLYFRKTPVVLSSDKNLLFLHLLAHTCLFLAEFTHLLSPTQTSCFFHPFLLGFFWTLSSSITFVKTQKFLFIFQTKLTQSRRHVWMTKTLEAVVIVTLLSIQVCFSLLAYSHQRSHLTYERSVEEIVDYYTCGDVTFDRIQMAFVELLLIVCIVQAYRARKLPANYNETKFIAFSILIAEAFLLIHVITSFNTPKDGSTIAIAFCANFSMLLITHGYKVYILWFYPRLNNPRLFQKELLQVTFKRVEKQLNKERRMKTSIQSVTL